MNTVYYFGCIRVHGHYLYHPDGRMLTYKDNKIHPWGDAIDGGIFQGSKKAWEEGLVHYQSKDGWSGISFADYSIDNRKASHSTFVVEGNFNAEELLNMAKEQWPQIFARPRFPTTKLQ